MRRNVDLRSEAYVFWTAVSDFRRDLRLGIPADYTVFQVDMDVIHELSEWPQIKIRCVDALIGERQRLHVGTLA